MHFKNKELNEKQINLEENFNNLYSYALNLQNESNGLKEELISLRSYIDALQFNNQKLNDELEKASKKIESIPANRVYSLGLPLGQSGTPLIANRLQKGFLSELCEKSQNNIELNNET